MRGLAPADIAWAAGVFDSSGYCTGATKKGGPPRTVHVKTTNRWILEELERLFGGKILGPYGPYASSTANIGKTPIPIWSLTSEEAAAFLRLIYSRLSPLHREQADRLFSAVG